ncbi:phosphoribosylformylglycinamidine cyclo-ligase [Thermodesulfatator autotrophicus]|uniref:Phosphoribosylformylglycinamidine cyclo-ligase n=1 Tax=Thermodesulfatator autotrophicus TaxID=1795632 RepID=A0A177E7Q8_9BACT|nr:phosphoribosylformylglycinamidine cyclo-ligase [Thermodesulfatator autotrophicus]OAG27470.1 phosphoribosylaminoimidazole synthetase [Thermodesulfatator autotrophicus]
MPTKAKRYAEAGVDIEAADKLVSKIKKLAATTFRRGVLTEIGGFAGLFALNTDRYKNPVLVSSTDGVGTKIKVAVAVGKHRGIGIDLVAMCVNDIIVTGAAPMFFLDYLAFGKINEKVALELIEGITEGCKEADCALIGGETAEMPGMYAEGDYDCVGFTVGVVDRDEIIDGSEIAVGDILLGLSSNGLHSNGFSLVRKILFEELKLSLDAIPEGLDKPLAEELLRPTKIYVRPVLGLLRQGFRLKGLAHITGGGFYDNIPRVLPKGCKAVINKNAWPRPAIFSFLQEKGQIPEEEMFQTFNCGIGMVLIVSPEKLQDIKLILEGMEEEVFEIGHIEARKKDEPSVIIT